MKICYTILLLTVSLFLQAQEKFGKASKASVLEEKHPQEADAHAAVLYQLGDVKMNYNSTTKSFQLTREVFKRIKIYDAEGIDYGTQTIPYYESGSTREIVSKIEGIVYNEENGKIVKSKLSKDGIFDEKTSKSFKQKKVALPNVKEGSVIDFKYKIVSPFYTRIPKWYFQYDIPCNQTSYTVEIPEWFYYNISSSGTVAPSVAKDEKTRTITFIVKYARRSDLAIKRSAKAEQMNYRGMISSYTTGYVPSLKDEDFVPYMNNYRSAISYELEKSMIPGQTTQNYNTSWGSIAKMLYKDDDLGKQVTKKFKELDGIVRSVSDLADSEKAEKLYKYVQDNYTWNGDYGHYADNGIKDLYKKGTGNVGDINLMLCKLFTMADLDATLVATKSRDRGFINNYYPSQRDLNYLLVLYTDGSGKEVLLDATDKKTDFGMLPFRAVNQRGVTLMENGGSGYQIKNPNIGNEKKIIRASLDDDLNLNMSCQTKLSGFAASQFKIDYSDYSDTEEYMEHVESLNADLEYNTFSMAPDVKNEKDIKVEEDFLIYESGEEIDGKIYINAYLGQFSTAHPYNEEKRNFPIFKDFMSNKTTIIQLLIPEGYQLESKPENMVIALPDKMGSFTYSVSNSADKIVIQIKKKENTDILSPQHYDVIKEYFNLIASKGNEKLVLAKI